MLLMKEVRERLKYVLLMSAIERTARHRPHQRGPRSEGKAEGEGEDQGEEED